MITLLIFLKVVGGRIQGVGVGGVILGGGYSWLTSRHGLAIDNMIEYELVQPNGNVVLVNDHSYPDLFFGLKVRFIFDTSCYF